MADPSKTSADPRPSAVGNAHSGDPWRESPYVRQSTGACCTRRARRALVQTSCRAVDALGGHSCAASTAYQGLAINARHRFPVAENVLTRTLAAPAPTSTWAADITYVPTCDGWVSLAVSMDVCSRRISGWSMQPTLARSVVFDALCMALQHRQPGDPLLQQRDHGSHYASGAYHALLRNAGRAWNMRRTRECCDTTPVESFFTQRVPAQDGIGVPAAKPRRDLKHGTQSLHTW